MAIGRTNAGGSGSAGLNFKVICNPQPSTAKENTIWIDTDRINNTHFSATQPENMADYDVWISTGTSSTVAFSVTRKNTVMVYPLSAKQCIGGAWVDKTAKSWQGGEWVDWVLRIFQSGVGAIQSINIYKQDSVTVTIDKDKISQTYSGGDSLGAIFTDLIDLTQYTKVFVEASVSEIVVPQTYPFRVCVTDTIGPALKEENMLAQTKISAPNTSRVVYELDISKISGKHYVAIGTGGKYTIYNWQIE